MNDYQGGRNAYILKTLDIVGKEYQYLVGEKFLDVLKIVLLIQLYKRIPDNSKKKKKEKKKDQISVPSDLI